MKKENDNRIMDGNVNKSGMQPDTYLQKIKKKIFKSEVDYFDMFVEGVSISLEAAKGLKEAFEDYEINQEELLKIKHIEHKGDKHMHKSLTIIEEAFITPIDQSDIMEILNGIEKITDSIDDVANHIYMLRISQGDIFMRDFLETMILSCEKLYELMIALKQYKKSPNKNITELTIKINELEETGDRIYMESMRFLFGSEKDPIEIIKKKETYQRFENTLDCCEDVADMVENLMIAKK